MKTPRDLFDEFFKTRRAEDQAIYRGLADLTKLQPGTAAQLATFRGGFQAGLDAENQDIPEHVSHPPFYIDFVDSDVPNAVAFRYCDWSFIGVTVPLVAKLAEHATFLSASPTVAQLLGVPLQTVGTNLLQAALFNFGLQFVISHEYVHHVFGHVEDSWNKPFFIEVQDSMGLGGSLQIQITEIMADGYGIYHVLSNAFGINRKVGIEALNLQHQESDIQDDKLMMAIILSVGAFILNKKTPNIKLSDVVWASHPPPVVRMNFIMDDTIRYLKSNDKMALARRLDRAVFLQLMNAALNALAADGVDYNTQSEFWGSAEAKAYLDRIVQGATNERNQLGSHK